MPRGLLFIITVLISCAVREPALVTTPAPTLDAPATAPAPDASAAAPARPEPVPESVPVPPEPVPEATPPAEAVPERCIGTPSPALARAAQQQRAWCEPDRNLIREAIYRHRRRIAACHRAGRERVVDLSGRVVVRFAIEPNGRVTQACTQEPTLPDLATVDCILRAFTAIRFPGWAERSICGPPLISYPVDLTPASTTPPTLIPHR